MLTPWTLGQKHPFPIDGFVDPNFGEAADVAASSIAMNDLHGASPLDPTWPEGRLELPSLNPNGVSNPVTPSCELGEFVPATTIRPKSVGGET